MEGNCEDSSSDDVEEQDRSSSRRSAVLWERCIQQSIIVDLSEDESFHLSDLERSFAVHVSQAESGAAEASVHLAENEELSASEDSSDCSSPSSPSERVVEGKTKSSVTRVSPQRHNTMMDDAPFSQAYEDSGQNTSDEDQEDLPYDGELRRPDSSDSSSTERNSNTSSDGGETPQASPSSPDLPELTAAGKGVNNVARSCSPVEVSVIEPSVPTKVRCSSPDDKAQKPDMTQLLFRHFSQEDLLGSGRLIEAETMPEVSLLESVDETLLSRTLRGGTAVDIRRNASDSDPSYKRSESTIGNSERDVCEGNGHRAGDESNTTSEISASLRQEVDGSFNNATSSATDSNVSNGETESGGSELSRTEQDKEDDTGQIVHLVRTRSFSELKYGQGQVHYPLPDFTVAPKVKIPKTPCSPPRPIAQPPSIMYRTQSSPGILEVISRVLEDSIQPSEKPYVFKDESKLTDTTTPALVDHLQAEYDKLLTKYAEAENLIDQMRLGTITQAPSHSDLLLEIECGYPQDNQGDGGHLGLMSSSLPPAGTANFVDEAAHQRNSEQLNAMSSTQLEPQSPSDGERLTDELRDFISHFMQKVEEFKLCLSSMSLSIAEQQMMLRSMMEAQDQLQRNYLSKKEEHRALEMQNYMGLSRNTGTFDPDRLVEGDIFRLGMHLEDLKEVIDRNLCEQLSPPHSSTPSTPLSLNAEPGPPFLITPSLTPTQHEGSSTCFSTLGYEMVRERKESGGEEEDEAETREDLGGDESEQSSEVITTDSVANSAGQSSSHPRHVEDSVEGPDLSIGEDDKDEEEGRSSVLTERIFNEDDILSYLTGSKSPSTDRRWTPESISTQCSGVLLGPDSECDLGASVSLAVALSYSSDALKTHSLSEPTLTTASISQRDLSPAETDSGFGSTYLTQPGSGPYQPQLLTDGVPPHSAGVSGSDSEGSWSNLQTAIHPAPSPERRRGSLPAASHPATPTGQRRGSCHSSVQSQPGAHLWAESSATEPRGADLHLPTHFPQHLKNSQSEPRLSVAMYSPQGDSDLHTCSCNSEAILALQSEVSRLKRDLEDGLVQLPHLTQRMDYLTSKYRHDRRPKTRSRSHHRPTSNSLRKTSVSRSERDNGSISSPNPVKIEDWISTDMDPSKSKGTDSGDTETSEILLQFHSSPAGSRRDCVGLYSAFELPGKTQQNKMLCDRGPPGPEENCSASGVTHSTLKTGKRGLTYRNAAPRTIAAGDTEKVSTQGWFSAVTAPSSQKPLLQVNYGSSCSLPASYKVMEPPSQCGSHHRKRSTQSDTALLPSNVYFQRTPPPPSVPSKTVSRTSRRRGSKEEEMNRTLDRAIEAARYMKRTTDHMAKSLSADLAKAQLDRKMHTDSMQPLGGRDHNTL